MTQFYNESDEDKDSESEASDEGSGLAATKTRGRAKKKKKLLHKSPKRNRSRAKVTTKPADQSGDEDRDSETDASEEGSGFTATKTKKGQAKKKNEIVKKSPHKRSRSRTKVSEKPADQSTMTQFYEYEDEEMTMLEMPGETDAANKVETTKSLELPPGRRSRSSSRRRQLDKKTRERSKDSIPENDNDTNGSAGVSNRTSAQKKRTPKKLKIRTSPVFRGSPQKRARRSLGGSQSEVQTKRNARGETPLHVAAIKGDVTLVKSMLESGAKPNVRDNAGWTPLHECCNHGYTTIVELLLNHGAMINIPGMENDTPLHDAVSNYRLDVVRLLVSRGASVNARNIHGKTPVDCARTEEMRLALETPILEQRNNADESVLNGEEEFQPLCFLGTALSRDVGSKLKKCASELHAKVVDTFTPEVSHLITSCNKQGQCPRTLKYLHAVLSGKWVVSIEWLDLCLEYKQKVCEEAFEVPGSSTNPDSHAATKGRLNRRQQLPSLFDGCQFYFHSQFHDPTPEKDELVNLVKSGGGKILSREPKLQNIDDYTQTVPYHAEKTSPLKDCGLYIVHDKKTSYPAIDSSRLCAVTANWIMDCIACFSLVDPKSS